MKAIILFILSLEILYPQSYQIKQITDFNFDSRNPAFLQYPLNVPWYSVESEIFFEAVYNDSSSSICLLKYDQPNDSFYQFTEITPLVDSNVIHRNVEGRLIENYQWSPLKIILWETNENGNWDIAFSVDSGDGWTKYEFIFSSPQDELDLSFILDPFLYNYETQFQFLYSKGNSVYFYSKGDSVQNEILFEGNDSLKYSDPAGAYSGYDGALYAVAIEEMKEKKTKIVYRKKQQFSNIWSKINTVFERVPPAKPKFVNSGWSDMYLAFEITTDRIKKTFLIRPEDFGITGIPVPLMEDPLVENSDFSAFSFGIITEDPQDDFYSYHPFTYRFKRNDSTYIRVGEVGYYYPYKDYQTKVIDSKPDLGPLILIWEGILSYTVWEDSSNGKINIYGIKRIDSMGDVKDEASSKKDFILYQNFPNPFNPITKISYELPKTTKVDLKIFNTLGQEISTLVNEEKPAGYYEIEFDASRYNLSSGIYFYELKSGNFNRTNKMIYLK